MRGTRLQVEWDQQKQRSKDEERAAAEARHAYVMFSRRCRLASRMRCSATRDEAGQSAPEMTGLQREDQSILGRDAVVAAVVGVQGSARNDSPSDIDRVRSAPWSVLLVVTVVIIAEAVTAAARGSHPIALCSAFFIGAFWVWRGRHWGVVGAGHFLRGTVK